MSESAMLTIFLVLGFFVLAGAVMAMLGWLLVLLFRLRERKRGPRTGGDQSMGVANGLFELSDTRDPEGK